MLEVVVEVQTVMEAVQEVPVAVEQEQVLVLVHQVIPTKVEVEELPMVLMVALEALE